MDISTAFLAKWSYCRAVYGACQTLMVATTVVAAPVRQRTRAHISKRFTDVDGPRGEDRPTAGLETAAFDRCYRESQNLDCGLI